MREEHHEIKLRVRRSVADQFFENIHWCAALVAAAFFVAVAAGHAFGCETEKAELAAVQAARKNLEDRANSAEFPAAERLKALDAELTKLSAVMAPTTRPRTDLPVGLTYPSEYLAVHRSGASNEIKFAAPIGLRASAEAGGVDLFWSDPAGNNVKIGEFEILRSTANGPASTVGSAEGGAFVFRDATAMPGVEYEYRIRAVAAEATGAAGGAAKSEPSDAIKIRAIADFRIHLLGATETGVVVKVEKWSDGAWKDRTFNIAEGEAVGARDEAVGVDFSTGRRLSKLAKIVRREPVDRDEVIFDADGRVLIEGGAVKRIKVASEDVVTVFQATFDGGPLPAETLSVERR